MIVYANLYKYILNDPISPMELQPIVKGQIMMATRQINGFFFHLPELLLWEAMLLN